MSVKENLEDIVLSQVEDSLYLLMDDLEKRKNYYTDNYAQQINLIIAEIENAHASNLIDELSILSFELSRISIDTGIYMNKVKTYKESLYIKPFPIKHRLDVSSIFQYFSHAKNCLYEKNQKNVFGLQLCEIDSEMNAYIPYFNMFAVNILRDVFNTEEITKSINRLKTAGEFFVVLHEIYEPPYLLFEKKGR